MTLVELMISMAGTAITAMAFVALFSLGTDMFQSNLEQIQTEESLSSAAYHLRAAMSQAVKVSCCTGVGCAGVGANTAIPFPTYVPVTSAAEPENVGEGKIDCRNGGPAVWTPGQQNALGIFIRDVGVLNNTFQAASDYRGTAIYFAPPVNDSPSTVTAVNSGRLIIREGTPQGGAYHDLIVLDRLVNVEVVPGSQEVAPSGYLRAISYKLTARYFWGGGGVVGRHYRSSGGAPTARYRDIEQTIKVVFRNNRIGESLTNGITSERPLGQIYFFKFVAPHLGAL